MPGQPTEFSVKYEPGGMELRVAAIPVLEEEQARRIGDDVFRHALEPDIGRVVVDVRGVGTATTGAVGELLSLHRRLLAVDRRLVLVADRAEFREFVASTPAGGMLEVIGEYPAGDPGPADEAVSFTADELRRMDQEGLTLGAAIAALDPVGW